MLKRLISLLTAAMLLFSTMALAETDIYSLIEGALYNIILRTEDEDILLGSGVLFLDNSVLLTAAGCIQEGSLYAIGTDGEHAVSSADKLDDSGIALLEMAEPSANTPLHMAAEDSTGMACIFGIDATGELLVAPLDQLRTTVYHSQEAMLLSSSEGLLPGGILADDRGDLIGLTIAQQAEGTGAYLALDAPAMYRTMTRQQYADAFLPVTAEYTGGILTITWTDEARKDGQYLITLSADDNEYYTYFEASCTEDHIEISVPPGHRYDFQVQWAENVEAGLEPVWGAMSELIVPSASFSDHSYQHTSNLVTRSGPHGALQPLPETSLAQMTDAGLLYYLQVESSYDVEEAVELPMTIELLSPDGQFYFESALCTLSPAKEKRDAFLLPLDALLADCSVFSGGTLQLGQYEIRFALGGAVAGVYSFTVTERSTAEIAAEEAAEAEKNKPQYGFVTDVTAEYKNGVITVTWPEDDIPDGARVDAFCLYDRNAYYIYQRMQKGENQAEFFNVPGRDTILWVTWTLDQTQGLLEPHLESDYFVLPAVPEEPFTLHGFENQRLSLVPSADPDAVEKGEYLPEVTLTRELLTNRDLHLYFQTEDTYQVTENSEGHAMHLVLCTPEDLCFAYPLEYLFDVNLQSSDLWLFDISSLCRDYESLICGAWPAGHYRLLYCIDGQVAGEFHFSLD